jgi:amidase
MARGAADLALALDVLAGPDEAQATGYRLALPRARHERLGDFRVLVLDAHPQLPLSNEIRAAMEQLAGRLQGAGCTVGRSSPLLPDLAAVGDAFTRLLMSFIGGNLPDGAYRALRDRRDRLDEASDDGESVRLRALVASHREWLQTHRRRVWLSHQWRLLFRAWDVVLCPVLPTTAFAHDDREMGQRELDVDGHPVPYAALATWAGPASLCGLPATAMPIGQGAGGLPIGMQVIGPYLEDRSTIAFAALAEREFGGYVAPPMAG